MTVEAPISPELALVDPDARKRALAEPPVFHAYRPPRARPPVEEGKAPERPAEAVPRPVSAVAYFAVGLVHVLIWGLAVIGAIALVAGMGFLL